MTEEISYYDEDLTELITEIERGIDGLRKLSPVATNQARPPLKPQRHGSWPKAWSLAARLDSSPPGRRPPRQRINELQGRMQRAKQVLQAFKVEMRELPREAAATYDAKAKAHHETLQKLHGDLQWAKVRVRLGSGLGMG